MLKYHKLTSLCIGLLFLIAVQKFAVPEPVFRFLVPTFLVYAAAVTFYNRWYLKKISKDNFWVLIRPLLLLTALFGIFLIIPNQALRGWFLIFAVAIITFVELILGNFAENIALNETLAVAFGIFFSFFGAYWYAANYEPLYLVGIFLGSALLTRSFYEFIPQPNTTKIIGAVAIGLFCSELYWALNFLHFHFSVLSLLLFNIFYLCLILNYYYLFHILSFKKIQFHLFLIAACNIVVFISTPWNVIR
jgi:hypothetical protein